MRAGNTGVGAATCPFHEKFVAQAVAVMRDDMGHIQSMELPCFARGGVLLALVR